jgi:poly [ADP-ribose] polymerase
MRFDPADLFSTSRDIEKQEELLDAMASVVVEEITEQAFNVTLEPVDDQTECRIKAMYKKTALVRHQSYGKRVKRVWRLRIEQMAMAYQDRDLGNERLLWHGTRAANLLSILHKGMIITRSYTHGRIFGTGLYFADCSTKAANYSTGYWSGTDSRSFVLLAAVKLGRSYEPTTSPYKTLPRGYQSIHAKAGKCSYLVNDEFIVYQIDQADPRFLVELA